MITLVNVKQMDEFSVAEWLKLAASTDPDRKNLQVAHGMAAADGWRIHVAYDVEEKDCECGDLKTHKNLNKVIQDACNAPFVFSVNRQFLLDALAGMDDADEDYSTERQMISFYVASPKSPIVIQGVHTKRTAVIMPMVAGIQGTPNIPKLHVPEEPMGNNILDTQRKEIE